MTTGSRTAVRFGAWLNVRRKARGTDRKRRFEMPELHTNDDLLDQYASGTLSKERLASVEEHLLICEACQSRLDASDEFAMLFRTTAAEPDVRSPRSWRMFWNPRAASWTVAAAAVFSILFLVA